MKNRVKEPLIAATVVALLVLAVLVDRFLPNGIIVSSLYSLPILLAAFYYSNGTIVATTGVVILLFVTEELYEYHNIPTTVFDVLGFLIIGYLALQFNLQRRKAQREAEKANQARERLHLFLGMVAHDLAQPLTSIRLNLSLMQKKGADKERLRKNLAFAADRTKRLVEDLRDAAIIETGNFTVRKEKADLVDVARKVVSLQQQSVARGKIELKAPKRVVGEWDQERLAQLLANIISNAVKYSRSPARISIDIKSEMNGVLIIIKDNGLGMTKEQLGRAFEPFSRFHEDAAKGAGLGLYISNWIVQAHRGKMWAKSKPGKGSQFFILLPR